MSFLYPSLILAAGVLWGTMGIFVRLLTSMGFTPIQVSALRLVSAALMFIIYLLIFDRKKLRVRLRDLPLLALTGILSIFLMSWFYFSAISFSSLSTAAILLYTAPIFVVIFSAVLFREKLTLKKLFALLLAVCGCVLVSGVGGAVISLPGLLFGLASGMAYASYSIFGKYALKIHTPITVTAISFAFAALVSLCVCSPLDVAAKISGAENLPFLILIIFLTGLLSATAPFILYTVGLSRTEAGKSSILASVEPVVATISGAVIYAEYPDFTALCGILLVLGAIVLLNIGKKHS